jgi:hypothetical protein
VVPAPITAAFLKLSIIFFFPFILSWDLLRCTFGRWYPGGIIVGQSNGVAPTGATNSSARSFGWVKVFGLPAA